jgi:hypothetical protein
MGAPSLEEIVRVTLKQRGITASESQITRIAYKGERAGPSRDAILDALECEIAALVPAHLDRLIAEKERELDALRDRRRGIG